MFRTKLNYQFTRAFSARVIVEYDSTLANPAATSILRTKQIGTQALLTWLPHPGTAVYVGYNDDLQNIDRMLCYRVPGGECDPNNTTVPRGPDYLNDGKQIFVKGVSVPVLTAAMAGTGRLPRPPPEAGATP